VPNLVGVDIGCGMETALIKANTPDAKDFDPVILDKIIHRYIPSGMNIRDSDHEFVKMIPFENIRCSAINLSRAQKSIGTLGGGNHFIEANRDDENNLYVVIHSGSRHLGKEVAEYYQDEAWKYTRKHGPSDIPKDLTYLSGKLFEDYINDMKIIQHFALINRKAMMSVIVNELKIPADIIQEQFSTIHNYIDTESMILRKGAVSAKKGEKLIIPINMRDGSLIAIGHGNADWNYSAPHGAGRIMSRTQAFASLNMDEYKRAMKGIYSTSVNKETLDESPMAYKKMDEIVANIKPTAAILKIIKPVYNYKAAEKRKR
jgi:RNA-splicing ligase RtcB